jgi:hypothetical protein
MIPRKSGMIAASALRRELCWARQRVLNEKFHRIL